MLRLFIVHICVKALFLELLCVFYILISNVTDVGCPLIRYVPILQRAIVLGIPAERVVQRERSSANKGASARKRWLAAALSEVCSSRWGIPPPQTPPSNCDCSRSEHRSSVWVGVSKALDRFVASLMVDLSSFNVVWRRKSTDKIQKSSESDLIIVSSASGEQRSAREGWVFVCLFSNMLLTTCSDLDAYSGMCLQLCIITCKMISCVLKFIKNVYWKCNIIFKLQITIASVHSCQEIENNMPQCLTCNVSVVYVPCEISVVAMANYNYGLKWLVWHYICLNYITSLVYPE